jgi:NAD(P)-dependent dehydrogenase (short-subunit alcohol dehydrogenase family)
MTSTVDGPAEVAGRVAVITGASRGLGAGLAARWAQAGLRLGLAARTEPAAPEGVESVTASVDVTDAEAVEHFCAAVAARFGRIDLWVNNAGVLEPIAPLRDADPAALRANVEVNVLGVLYGSATFARHVRSRAGGGVLVNITSGAATSPYAGWAAYCGSKAAVDQITRVVAEEEIEAGLRAYAVGPGIVDTAMQEAIRATPEERFPAVERFRGIARDGAFNSPAWVADHILGLLAYPPSDLDLVVLRVPDQPRA